MACNCSVDSADHHTSADVGGLGMAYQANVMTRNVTLSRDEAEFIVDRCEETRIPQWMQLAADIRMKFGMAPYPSGSSPTATLDDIIADYKKRYGDAWSPSIDTQLLLEIMGHGVWEKYRK